MLFRVNVEAKNSGGVFFAVDVDAESANEAFQSVGEDYDDCRIVSAFLIAERACRGGNCDE